jgi:hypothetical protein
MKLITHNNRTQSIAAWAREAGLTRQVLAMRLARGQSLEIAIVAETVDRREAGRRGGRRSRWRGRFLAP